MRKILLLIVLFLFPVFVLAETCSTEGITIKEITLEELSEETLEKAEPTVDGMNISLDLKMKEVGDYAKYKITIQNDTDENYEFNKDNLITNSEFIRYTFDTDENKIIKAHETLDIYLMVEYKEKVSASAFQNGVFTEEKNVTTVLNEEPVEPVIEQITNPSTGASIASILIIIFLGASAIYLLSHDKGNTKNLTMILILLGFFIPTKIYSLCSYDIQVESNIEIEEYHGRSFYHVVKDGAVLDSIQSEYVSENTGVDFTEPSSDTNGKGLYIREGTQNDEFPVYYYRGDVQNNNVLFGGYCWKILRTTSTGGTKLVYNGVPTEGTCDNMGEDTLIATSVKWGLSGNLSYFGYSYEEGHTYKNAKISGIPNGAVFAEDVTYEDGKYLFSDEKYIKDSTLASTVEDSLSNHHYSCFKTEDQICTKINYVYMTRGGYLYYIILENGDKIEDALANDLTKSSNAVDSNIKTYVETWYQDHLTEYTKYLEDTEWCNDRSIGSYGAWEKNGPLADKIEFGGLSRAMKGKPSVVCKNKNDRFTMNEETGNGKANYPIGLITLDESLLAGFAWDHDDETNYLYNEKVWWTMSPTLVSVQLGYIGVLHSMADNVTTVYITNGAGGVRPAISLNHQVRISEGEGTVQHPFQVEEMA